MQKKWKLRQQRTMIYMMVTMIVMLLLLLFLYLKSYNDSQSMVTVKIGDADDKWDMVSVGVDYSKFWINNYGLINQSVGAQYDGIIVNKSNSDITDWQLIITMPEEGRIDSFWNGNFYNEGKVLTFVPDENIKTIAPGECKTFGFVMISDNIMEFENMEFTGYRQKGLIQYELFWLLIVSAVIWVAFLMSYIMVSRQIRQYEKRRQNDTKIISETMEMFAEMIDAKDSYTRGHSVRVAYYAKEIGRRMQMDDEEIDTLGYVALMHDCGKMGIPDSVLSKPDILGPDEKKVIREHTVIGGKMLENFTSIDGIKEGALYHHERYDGSGYPLGLKGEEIPLFARIICIADSFDAMNTNRCYQDHRNTEVILQELRKNAGTQFDPDIVKYMIEMIKDGYCDSENVPET